METQKKQENVVLGTIGAIVGAILGSIVWILLDQVGFIASLAAFAIIACGIKGYEFLGGKLSKKGIIICVVVTVITVLLADIISMGISIFVEFSGAYDITIIDALLSVPSFLTEPKILFSFLKSLAMGYVFVALGCYKFVGNLWNTVDYNEERENIRSNYFDAVNQQRSSEAYEESSDESSNNSL